MNNSEMEPVRMFDDRYRYRSNPVRPDRTGLPSTDRSEIQTGTGFISGTTIFSQMDFPE
jgi:hypothetical protein